MSELFQKLGLCDVLLAGLDGLGITQPTEIQQQVIPAALIGKDVVGQSATGTGKTLAYLLPLMQKIDVSKREVQAVILAPTHELASQIHQQILDLADKAKLPVTSALIIGNVNIARQIEKLKDKPHIIVGSSGRILELIQKKKISAPTIRTIVLDEADRLLDDNNLDGVKAVIKTTLRDRQLMMFSATMPAAIMDKAKELMREPEVISAKGQANVPQDISHMYFVAEHRDKIEMLRKLVRHLKIERALVFINKSDNIETMVEKLNYHGLNAAAIHGDANKLGRKAAIDGFRKGKIELLVASDLAARGLDIPGVTHVFNLDMPETPQIYLHRVGRTGRAGQSGTAISIVTVKEAESLKRFEKVLKITIVTKSLARGQVFDRANKRNS
ncbi:DEAD-box ATP-dependent RNA helicase CshC [bioreactor metagenome]|uniref:DEAD-box ATP-dependent RNA helicase CshC n=1 Tax=bioreactor metagenome TaxID=1076179 RepID=A0A645C8S6_9ZZZZ